MTFSNLSVVIYAFLYKNMLCALPKQGKLAHINSHKFVGEPLPRKNDHDDDVPMRQDLNDDIVHYYHCYDDCNFS